MSGAKAQYQGSGTINGRGDYDFMVTVIDGQWNGGREGRFHINRGVDKLRIQIWDKTTGEIVYDNQMGSEDDAIPATAIDGGSIVIHTHYHWWEQRCDPHGSIR